MRRAGEGKPRSRSPKTTHRPTAALRLAKQGSFEKRARKPPPRVFVPRNPEPQPVRSVGERPGEDPAVSNRSKVARALSRAARRKRRVPPTTREPPPLRSASSRAASWPRRSRIASVQARSASAFVPIAIAGPLTGHSPSATLRERAMSGEAMAKPRRRPARPERARPNDRSTTAPMGRTGARLSPSPSKSAKASSTIRTPPRRRSRASSSSSSARGVIRPSGLLGLTTMATSKAAHVFDPLRLLADLRAHSGECRGKTAVSRPKHANGAAQARSAPAFGSAPASRGRRRHFRRRRLCHGVQRRRPRASPGLRFRAAATRRRKRDRAGDRGAD